MSHTSQKLLGRVDSRPHPSFLGCGALMERLLEEAEIAALGSDRPILITGPVGAGKSHLARYIHGISPRSAGPLVFVPCGALGDLDNSLFGHMAGAFTGAVRRQKGRLEEADGGILVLDDFERLTLPQQDRLHRVVVDGQYYPVGAERPERVNVRFLATSNCDVPKEVRAGRLKEDFVSRLDYFHLRVPSLAERPEDIPGLCRELLRRNLQELRQNKVWWGGELEFEADCWPAIQARRFRDNVRGLDKLIVRLIAQTRGRDRITPADVEAMSPGVSPSRGHWFDQPLSLRKVRDAAERDHIVRVCHHTSFNLRQAARVLGISPKTLYSKLRHYGITRP